MKTLSTIWLIHLAIVLNLLSSNSVKAQIRIIPDGTLPQNSIVTQEGNTLKIEGGTQAGQNLFHSFQEFTVLTNQTAFFNNGINIQNIFSRVTGASISTIDGIIKANGGANLFLINPNGIVFGVNANLNIGGSFVASTAERVIFSDGSAFNTINPQNNPLLTISVPIGLGFGSTPRQINNQSVAGLQVKTGKTIALVGGDVILQGGHLTANEGRIEIGSVAGNNTINLVPIVKGWQLDYTGVQSFQDISLLPRTLIDTSGNVGGEIQLQGRRIILTGDQNSPPVLALSNTVGNGKGGDIVVKASDSIEISGQLSDPSGFRTQTEGVGSAGNIQVETKNLTLNVGGQISSSAGPIIVRNNNPASTGNAGDITIRTQQFNILGGRLSTNSYTNGQGGQLNIVALGILIKNGGEISVENFFGSTGDAGDLNITTYQLILNPFGFIISDANGMGNAGDINLNVNKLALDTSSQITANTFQSGKGGVININANESVEILNNGSISSRTQDLGDGGDLIINTNNLNLQSNARVDVTTSNMGKAGSLTINANNLNVSDGGQINAKTEARGQAGNIDVTASNVTISSKGRISTETTSPNARVTSTGNAGNITLNVGRLILQEGGEISSGSLIGSNPSNIKRGNGGTITINANEIDVSGSFTDNKKTIFKSRIQTLAEGTGDAGSIFINTRNLNVTDQAQITASTTGTGVGGDITIQGNLLRLDNQASVSAETASTDGGNITLNLNDRLILRNQSNLSATAGAFGNGGNITINSPFILAVPQEDSDITANAEQGSGGNINITTQGIFGIEERDKPTPLSDITASSEFGVRGNINIFNPNADVINRLVEFPETPVDVASLVAENVCTTDRVRGSSFVVTGRGGLPPNPSDPLTQNGTVDWATRSPSVPKTPVILKERSHLEQPVIQQIQGWKTEADGTIILTADATAVTPESPILTHPTCQ